MDTENGKKVKRRKSKKAVKDEGQSLDWHNIAEGNLIMEELKVKDELQSMDQNKIDTGPIENLAEGTVTGKRKRKRKTITGAVNEDGVQTEMDARSRAEGSLTTMKSKIKDEVQNIGPATMDIGSTETFAEGNVNIVSPKTQSMYQTNVDNGDAQTFIKGITPGKKRKTKKKARDVDEVQKQMDATSTVNLDEGSLTIDKPKVEDECQSLGQNQTGSTDYLADGKVIIENPETQDEDMDQNRMDTRQLVENPAQGNVTEKRRKKRKGLREEVNDSERDTARSTQNIAEKNVTVEKKQKPKKTNKEKVKDGSSGRMDAGSTDNLAEVNVNIRIPEARVEVQSVTLKIMNVGSTENPTKGSMNFEIPKVQDENQSIENSKMDTGPIHNFSEGNVTVKRKKKPKKEKANVMDKLSGRMGAGSTENLAEVMDAGSTEYLAQVMNAGSTGNPTKVSVTVEIPKVQDENQSIENQEMDTQNFAEENVTAKRRKKPKKEKANVMDRRVDAGSTENLAEVVMDAGSTENLAQVMNTGSTGNHTKGSVAVEIPKVQDENQSIENKKMDTRPTQNFAEGNVTAKRKKKTKKEKANVMDSRMGAGSTDAEVMEAGSTENLAQVMNAGSTGNPTKGSVTFEIPKVQDENQSIENQKIDIGTQNFAEGNVTLKRKKKPKKEKANGMDELSGRMDAGSTENLAEVMNAGSTGSPTKGSVTNGIDELSGRMDAGSTENLAEVMNAGSTGSPTKGSVTFEIPKVQDESQSIEIQNFAGENVTKKRKKKPKKKVKSKDEISDRMDAETTENLTKGSATSENPKNKEEGQSMDKVKMDTGTAKDSTEEHVIGKSLTGSPTNGSVTFEIPKVQDESQSIENQKISEENVTRKGKKKPRKKKVKAKEELSGRMDAETTENLTKGSATSETPKNKEEGQSMDKVKMDTGTAKDSTEEHVTGKRRKKRRRTSLSNTVGEFLSVNQDGTMLSLDMSEGPPNILVGEKAISLNGLSQVSNAIILDEGIGHAEGRSAISTCNAFTVKDAEVLCPRTAPFASVGRKLLVLDINGLLGDIVYPAPKDCQADIKLCGRAVFRRPFCDDFLKFCFQNFYVGIWSSRTKRIIDVVVNYLLGDQRDKLVFCWDVTHSTASAFNTLENCHKPLVCKELRKIWEQDDPSWPWKRGDYNESNTLLLDDSPYKALLNPLHTAIFPHPFQYSDKNDNSLGPGGAIRVYLEGLLTSENVQKYVEQHPFGQSPINEQDPSWEFYDRVINQMSNQVKDKTPHSA